MIGGAKSDHLNLFSLGGLMLEGGHAIVLWAVNWDLVQNLLCGSLRHRHRLKVLR